MSSTVFEYFGSCSDACGLLNSFVSCCWIVLELSCVWMLWFLFFGEFYSKTYVYSVTWVVLLNCAWMELCLDALILVSFLEFCLNVELFFFRDLNSVPLCYFVFWFNFSELLPELLSTILLFCTYVCCSVTWLFFLELPSNCFLVGAVHDLFFSWCITLDLVKRVFCPYPNANVMFEYPSCFFCFLFSSHAELCFNALFPFLLRGLPLFLIASKVSMLCFHNCVYFILFCLVFYIWAWMFWIMFSVLSLNVCCSTFALNVWFCVQLPILRFCVQLPILNPNILFLVLSPCKSFR